MDVKSRFLKNNMTVIKTVGKGTYGYVRIKLLSNLFLLPSKKKHIM